MPHISLVIPTVALALLTQATAATSLCKTYPDDAAWPTTQEWTSLNKTVGGRLISTIPIAAVCHDGPLGSYDEAACTVVQDGWSKPYIHSDHPSSIFSPLFTNRTCLQDTDQDIPCTIGYYPWYVINATDAADVQAGVNFARKHNLRLVVKNSGHDFFGKSTGYGALSIWTRHFTSMEYIEDYKNPSQTSYQGPAAKVGAGVRTVDVYEFADSIGMMMVGGEQPTVGLAGGFSAGGGHSPLSPLYGMGADQVIELEVVLASGELITVSPKSHPLLYWAMRGGGGGVFGVVISMVIKAHPGTKITTMPLAFASDDSDAYWTGVKEFFSLSSKLQDHGIYTYSAILANSFSTQPIFAPNMTVDELHAVLQPLYNKLDQLGITYNNTATTYPTFLEAWEDSFNAEVTGVYSGSVSRLVPAAILDNDLDNFMEVFQNATSYLGYFAGFFMRPSKAIGGAFSDNAVNPAWRATGLHALAGYVFDENITDSEILVQRNYYTNNIFQPMRDITPGAGCYQSESALTEPNWQQAYHGIHYPLLYVIKKLYDPDRLFYATQGVGSEDWSVDDGKLCAKSSSSGLTVSELELLNSSSTEITKRYASLS